MDLRGVRVLLVDDSTDSTELYEMALGLEGAEVAAVVTVSDALAALDATPFDVIVSDIYLGEVDGYELARTLRRRSPRRGGAVAAIALTGLAYPTDREAALAAGFDEHLTKPCAPSKLAGAIRDVLARTSGRAAAREASGPATLTGLRVLVVDDREVDRYLLERALATRGADVLAVASADEAIAAIEAARPDVLVSDLLMPSGSGYELLNRVRALGDERGGRVPAVAVTVLESAEDRAAALSSGFAEHIPKPFDPDRLAAIIAGLAATSG